MNVACVARRNRGATGRPPRPGAMGAARRARRARRHRPPRRLAGQFKPTSRSATSAAQVATHRSFAGSALGGSPRIAAGTAAKCGPPPFSRRAIRAARARTAAMRSPVAMAPATLPAGSPRAALAEQVCIALLSSASSTDAIPRQQRRTFERDPPTLLLRHTRDPLVATAETRPERLIHVAELHREPPGDGEGGGLAPRGSRDRRGPGAPRFGRLVAGWPQLVQLDEIERRREPQDARSSSSVSIAMPESEARKASRV